MRRAARPVALLLVTLGAACADAPSSDLVAVLDALPQPAPSTTAAEPADDSAVTTTPSRGECEANGLATSSLRPDQAALAGAAPAGSRVAAIRQRGRLVVGVDENTLGFAYLSPTTGEIEGFEIDLAEEIAARIFDDQATGRVELVPVVTGEKFAVVEKGQVDITISANTMTCERWERVAFSTEYYTASQQFLVRKDSTIETADDLVGARVCVTAGSSSSDLLRAYVPQAVLQPEPDRTGCLLELQEGRVHAYFGHDSFLYGMAMQDPNFEPRDMLPPEITVSHYGIAISHDHPDLVRFVNAVLEELRSDGTWDALHARLQADIGVPPAVAPLPRYRDE